MKLPFQKRAYGSIVEERHYLLGRYRVCRLNLLAVMAFTLLNIALLLFGADYYLLFSATIPYYMVFWGLLLCGKFAPEIYEMLYGEGVAVEFLPGSVLVVAIVMALLITLLYLLCFFLSNHRRVAWLKVAAVLFTLDTIGMLLMSGFAVNMILDLVFHVWVLYYLFAGIKAEKRLRVIDKMIAEQKAANAAPAESTPTENTVDF